MTMLADPFWRAPVLAPPLLPDRKVLAFRGMFGEAQGAQKATCKKPGLPGRASAAAEVEQHNKSVCATDPCAPNREADTIQELVSSGQASDS